MTNQNHILHIQYPVGQGGLHLGIIGDVAYIYDCGGYGKNVDWDVFIEDICNKIKHAQVCKIYIFISHLHEDHCNKLKDVYQALLNIIEKERITVYIPEIQGTVHGILLLCHYKGSDFYHYRDIINGLLQNNNTIDSVPVVVLKPGQENNLINSDTEKILLPYVTRIQRDNLQKMKTKWESDGDIRHFNQDLSIDECGSIIKIEKDYLKYYNKYIKNGNDYTHESMLCVYCMSSPRCLLSMCFQYFCCSVRNVLHTGDALIKTRKQREGFINHFGSTLKYATIVQIPHHGSQSNHDKHFTELFFFNGFSTMFFYTIGGGTAQPRIDDLNVPDCKKLDISDNPITKITI